MTRDAIRPVLLVDAIVAKRNTGTKITDAHGVEALGPGFTAGSDVDAVIETKRGPTLGRVIWEGEALPDTGIPGEINGFSQERVLRAPCNGVFRPIRAIGDRVSSDEVVAYVDEAPIRSRLGGVVHGLLEPGMTVAAGFKVGDVDPRASREECFLVSDKALAVAGGVLEAACALLGGVSFRDWPPHPATDPQRP
jgi:xanthine dehydrogenase accessory factor